jgi:hypothetical protein
LVKSAEAFRNFASFSQSTIVAEQDFKLQIRPL